MVFTTIGIFPSLHLPSKTGDILADQRFILYALLQTFSTFLTRLC